MPRMIDLIRASALPSHRMHSAARGALTVPPAEMIEILVHLANHNKIFGQQARMTLAGYDEASSIAVAKDPHTPKEVLQYMISGQNLRPALLPALLENPSVTVDSIVELAGTASNQIAEVIGSSQRAKASTAIQQALASNANLKSAAPEKQVAGDLAPVAASSSLQQDEEPSGTEMEEDALTEPPSPIETSDAAFADNPLAALQGEVDIDETVMAYLTANAAEIEAEGEKPFQAIGGIFDTEIAGWQEPGEEQPVSGPSDAVGVTGIEPATTVKTDSGTAAATVAVKHSHPHKKQAQDDGRRDNTLQKIAKLDVKGRIQLAMKGNKEERSILIRDGTKLVAIAVLESGKITDSEVEQFATQKNVLEAVLRAIPMKRRFAKNYSVLRNLVFNPRTPLDVSLGLMKHLLVQDLRHLSGNKEVSETVRKLAIKMFKQKTDASKKKE